MRGAEFEVQFGIVLAAFEKELLDV